LLLLPTGTANTFEVAVIGTHFDFLVGGVRVGSYDSASYTGGRVGLAVSDAMEVVLSDLVIARIA